MILLYNRLLYNRSVVYVSEQTGFGPEKVLITNSYALSLTAAAALPGHPELLAVVQRRRRTHRRRRRRRRVLQPRMHRDPSDAAEASTAADSPG